MTNNSLDNPNDLMAEKIRSGEYFREARRAYADIYLDPMSERYFFIIVTLLSLLIFFVSSVALSRLYPLAPEVPFAYPTQNFDEEMPVISPLAEPGVPPNLALKQYLLSEYIRRREAFDFGTLETNVRVVHSMSEEAVYNDWQKELDPANPQSPIAQFERHTTRHIQVISARPLPDGSFDVTYVATLSGPEGVKKAAYIANIAFRYTEVTVDQTTGKAPPVNFTVTAYQTRRVEE